MKINKKRHGTVNPKTEKKYSLDFKKRTVEYYLFGMYDEATIWKKFHVNRTLLIEWRKWYYKYFESKDYSTPNYGKDQFRPHSSLDYLTPEQAHIQSGQLKKRWKNPVCQK